LLVEGQAFTACLAQDAAVESCQDITWPEFREVYCSPGGGLAYTALVEYRLRELLQ
jgi:hypothetical protein